MKTVTLPLEEYEKIADKAQAMDEGKIYIGPAVLGYRYCDLEICGLDSTTESLLLKAREAHENLQKQYWDYKKANPIKIEVTKKETSTFRKFFKW